MKLAVFGATGRTGRPLVDQALARGHDVVAFVRDPSKLDFEHPRLTVAQGDVQDPGAVERAVAGTDAVLSTIGHTSSSRKDVQTAATRNIVNAVKKHGVRRFISETGAGVRDPRDPPQSLGGKFMTGLLKLLAKDVLEDAENHAAVLRSSDLDWIIVRAPRLTEGSHTGVYRSGFLTLGPGEKISRADVADFMLKQLTDDTFVRQAPMVSY